MVDSRCVDLYSFQRNPDVRLLVGGMDVTCITIKAIRTLRGSAFREPPGKGGERHFGHLRFQGKVT
jgi:hypothetical protein